MSGGSVHVDESAGTEDNTITINYSAGAWSVHEAGASPLTPGSGCSGTATDVTCTTGGPIQAFVNDAGGTNSYTMNASFPSAMDGGTGSDTLIGGPSSDALRGHGGNDSLSGRGGSNTLQGGAGADSFAGGTGSTDYTIVEYADGEHLNPVTVTLDGVANDGGIDDASLDNVATTVNEVDGTSGGDTITGGGSTTHTLFGAGGDDTITAGSSAGDELAGGAGNDTLVGGPGFDRVSYGYVTSSPGVTATLGSGGTRGAGDTDTYSGSIQELDGSTFADTLSGSSGDDYLKGEGGDDTLDGKAGNDHLYGDADTIFFAPSSDDDTLTGGPGNDRLIGNEGNDTLHLDDGEADTLGGGSDCDGALPSGTSGGTDDAYAADSSDTTPVNCERNLGAATTTTTPGGTTSDQNSGGTPGPTTAPVNTVVPRIVGATAPFKLGRRLGCDPGTWTPAGYTITGYHWYRYAFTTSASPFSVAPKPAGSGQTYTVVAADQGQMLACAATVVNAAGASTMTSARASVIRRLRIPTSIRGKSLGQAQAILRHLYGGAVSFGTKAEQRRAGASLATIPCEFGGENKAYGCDTPKEGTLDPGRVFNSTPPVGHYVDEAYGSGKLPKIVLDWYDSSKDRSDDVPPATPKVRCPAADSADVERDFENRILGHYAQYARDLLAKYNCPFGETTRYSADQTVDPYVTEVQGKSFQGDHGYQITITAPKRADLAAVVFHRRLHGQDFVGGADLSRGPVDPGLGTDGRLTALKGTQKNDICFHVVEVSTGRGVPGAVVLGYAPNGSEAIDMAGNRDYIRTDANGDGCTSWMIRESGTYRFVYTYYGANGTNEEGSMSLQAVNRGNDPWTTISGREMKCDAAKCDQTGFATSRRAHAASVLGDIGAAIGRFLAGLIGGSSPVVNKANVQDAAKSDGSASATLVHAQVDNGITAGVLVVKGTAKLITNDGGSLITNDGGSIISDKGYGIKVKTASLITNDGGSLVALASATGARPAVGATIVVGRDGRIISNDGASLITENGAGLLADAGAGLRAPAGGAVMMYGDKSVIAAANGVISKGTLITNDGGSAIPVAGIG